MKNKVWTIMNFKGGIGKTSLTLALALHLGFDVITNDLLSPLEQLFNEDQLIKLGRNEHIPDLPDACRVIFDFGGHVDKRVIKALKFSQFVIIPVMVDSLNLEVSNETIIEVSRFTNNIVLCPMSYRTPGELKNIEDGLIDSNFPVFPIKYSKAVPKMFDQRRSLHSLRDNDGLSRYHYTQICNQIDELIRYLQGDHK
jgi:cellulose biosynthesis protein BcsQ